MLPNVSKLRLDGGGAARKPAPTDDNLVPLSVLDEPMTVENLENWGDITARKAHDWFKTQGEDQRMCMYTTDSLAQGCDPQDTETWNQLFWVAVKPEITIPYAARVSNSVPPEPDWAAMSVALPIPKPWLEDGPQAIIQVTPSTAQGVPGVHFVHKTTLLKMFAIQRQKYPDGVDGVSYPNAYKGPGYGKPDFFVPRYNETNHSARMEMTAILYAFLAECDSYRTTIGFFLRDGTTLKAPIKLYEKGCDLNRHTYDFEDASGEFRQTNPFPTPWKYGTGTHILHYTNYMYTKVDNAARLERARIFAFGVTEAPRPATPPPRRRTLPASITQVRGEEEEEEEDEEEDDDGDPMVYGSGGEEEDEEEEEEDEEMQDSVPGPMTDAINDANALEEASSYMVSLPEDVITIVGRITLRLQNVDLDYAETLSDPDLAAWPFIRGLATLWERFHLLPQIDAIKVLALLDHAYEELGEYIKFRIRQLVTSDVPRLLWWQQSNLRGVPEDDPRLQAPGGLLLLAQGNTYLNRPKTNLEYFASAVDAMVSRPRGSEEWRKSYHDVTKEMRRIAYLADRSDDYLQRVTLMQPRGLAETVLRLDNTLLWDDFDDDWDIRHVREYMQLPFIRFLDTMTDLTKDMPRGFMNTLGNRKSQIIISLETFWREYDSDEPELARMIQRVVERLEATPPPPPLALQQRQASVPAVQGAEALREIANSPSPEREEDEDEELRNQRAMHRRIFGPEGILNEPEEPTPQPPAPAPPLRRNSSDGYQTRSRTRQRTGAALRRAGLLPRFF